MDIGGRKAFILAPGCDLAMATPSENILAVSNLVRDVELQAEIRASEAPVNEVEKLDLTSHWEEDKVVIDIITLDSSSCAPCQYMVNAVARASEKFGDKVIYTEHRIKEKEGVQMMASLGVRKIPTIVMNGVVEFSSQIPPIQEIQKTIEAYLKKK
jgi:thiol-disulfide isomerase/thioredoxin